MLKDKATTRQIQDTNLIGKEFCQYLVETVKAKKQSKETFINNMSNRHNPRRNGSSNESPQGGKCEKIFFKTESQHECSRTKVTTTNFIKMRVLEQVITNFQGETLLKRSYPELIQ